MAEVVVALDLDSVDAALRLVDALPSLGWAKVGPILFVEDGPRLVRELKARDTRVFLDLKWHDIPHTVAGAAAAAARLGVDLASVHALGGRAMIRAAADVSGSMRLAAVSVLTSHSASSYFETVGHRRGGGKALATEVVRMSRMAVAAGAGGIVTSAHEAPRIREIVGVGGWIIVPGIRPAGSPAGDQRRHVEPGEAVAAGATHLVVGRPITRAKDPRAVYDQIRGALGLNP